jgi:glycosyltransferase involved in cell wall biosynthesis
MKITFVVPRFRKSGPTTQLRYIITSLLEFNAHENIQIQVITLRKESNSTDFEAFSSIKGLTISPVKSSLNGLHNLIKIWKAGEDVVISTGLIADLACLLFAQRSGWISMVRSFPPDDYKDKFGVLSGAILSNLVKKILGRATLRVAVSESLRERLGEFGLDTVTIRNGVRLIEPKRIDIPPKEVRKFLIVGNLRSLKNIDNGIKLFLKIRNNNDVLNILGDGPLRVNLEHAYAGNQHIRFIGYENDIGKYYAEASCLISLSYSEGMPNVVLEALSWGIPCLLSPIPPHCELKKIIPEAISTMTDTMIDLATPDFLLTVEHLLNIDLDTKVGISSKCNDHFGLERLSEDYKMLIKEIKVETNH